MLHRYSLPNGLQVWFQPNPGSESVAILLALRAGLRYEDGDNNGISHFVEHMLFAGTERWSAKQLRQVITQCGGRMNGWTGVERTVIFAHVSVPDFDLGLDWLSQVVFHSAFPAERIERERRVIFQEGRGRRGWLLRKLNAHGFGSDLSREVRQALFSDEVFGLHVLGNETSLRNLDRGQLLAFYARHYTPANAVLIVVGGADHGQVVEQTETRFGYLDRGNRPAPPTPPPMPDDGPQHVVVRGPTIADRARLRLGTRTVARTHPDRWALDVLAWLLRENIRTELRFQRGLVYDLKAYNIFLDDAGYLTISTTCSRDRWKPILDVMETHLERVHCGKIDPQKVRQAQAAMTGRWTLSMESNVKQAMWLARWSSALSAEEPVPNFRQAVAAVTPADLPRVVERYFAPERRYLGLHLPVVTIARAGRVIGAVTGVGLVAVAARKLLSQKS